LLYYNIELKPKNNLSQITGRYNFYVILYKTGLILVETMIIQAKWTWISWVYMLIASGLLFFTGGISRTYFSVAAQNTFMCFTFLSFWVAIVFACASIVVDADPSDFLEVFVAGTVFFIIIIIMRRDKDLEYCLCNTKPIKTEQDLLKFLIAFVEIVLKYVNNIKTDEAILKGYIKRHAGICKNDKCGLKSYSETHFNFFNNEATSKRKEKSLNEAARTLLNHCEEVFCYGINMFPSNNKLKLLHAHYLINVTDNKGAALEKLETVELCDPNFEEKDMIHALRAKVKDFLLSKKKGDKEHLSVTSLMTYESHLKIFNDQIDGITQLHYQFWSAFLEDVPDLTLLKNYGFKIQDFNESIREHWEAMQRINPDAPNALKLYSVFLSDVMNDKEYSNELMEVLKKIDVVKINLLGRKTDAANSCDVQTISFNGDPCLCISGKIDRLGYITHCNLAMCRLFGYTQQEMLKMHVNELMPGIYAKDHMKMLIRSIEHPETRDEAKKEFNVPIKNRNGYLVTICGNLLSHPTLLNEDNFVTLMRVDKAVSNYDTFTLLLDTNAIVIEMSSTGEFFLGKLYNVRRARIPFTLLCPDIILNEESPSKFEVTTNFYPIDTLNDDEVVRSVNGAPIKVRCTVETALMANKKIGYFIKLVVVREISKQPVVEVPNLFKFLYDENSNKYLRTYGNVNLKLSNKKLLHGSHADETHSQVDLKSAETKRQREDLTAVELLQDASDRMGLCKGHFLKTLAVHIQNTVKILNSKIMSEENVKINKEFQYLLEKDFIDYGGKVGTYRLIGEKMVYIDDTKIDISFLLDDSESEGAHKANNRSQHIIDKKNALLLSANIKGKRSLESTLVQVKKTHLKLIYLFSYVLFAALFALAIVYYLFLKSFLDELAQRTYLLSSSYQCLVYSQSISFRVREIYFTQL
jgi:PAS domain S-box-containing protein